MLIGRRGIEGGVAHARWFDFIGLKWTRFGNGTVYYIGAAPVLVFYVRVWREP